MGIQVVLCVRHCCLLASMQYVMDRNGQTCRPQGHLHSEPKKKPHSVDSVSPDLT